MPITGFAGKSRVKAEREAIVYPLVYSEITGRSLSRRPFQNQIAIAIHPGRPTWRDERCAVELEDECRAVEACAGPQPFTFVKSHRVTALYCRFRADQRFRIVVRQDFFCRDYRLL